MFIEVIATSLEDVKTINKSNAADQIEYCIELNKGGTTPKIADIKKCCEISRVPIRVMVRVNEHYKITDSEFQLMKDQIIAIKRTKAWGVVFGWVNDQNSLDIEKLTILCKLAYPLKCTFHRAFDALAGDVIANAKKLYAIGFDTILTTGANNDSILKNIHNLQNLSKTTYLRILCGKGIDQKTAAHLKDSGLNNVHIGSVIRQNGDWNKPISFALLDAWSNLDS